MLYILGQVDKLGIATWLTLTILNKENKGLAVLANMWLLLIWILICSALVISYIEHLCMNLLDICTSNL
jgi:hypothetical protein